MSFATYAAGFECKELEFTTKQTTLTESMMGEEIADENFFSHLVGQNILDKLLLDKDFLEQVEMKARSDNHPALIKAAQDLKRGICAEEIVAVHFPFNYREYVMEHYFEYLLSCKGMRVNAHPEGLYIVIQSKYSHSRDNAGVNDLNIDTSMASSIQEKMEALVKATYPPSEIFQYLFFEQAVPNAGVGRYLEITNPSAAQIEIAESLFNLAATNGFFPENAQEMIRKVWVANCAKISKAATSSWGPGSPALLSAPARASKIDGHMDITEVNSPAT